MKRVLATVLGASLLLAGCGQSSTPAATTPSGAPIARYGDGLDHSWTASTAEGQRLYAALSQGLKSQDFNIGLSVTATSGWGPIELNTSNGETPAGDGKPITLNGQVYSTGLGVHANSEIHVHATNLETPACTRFQADVGLDDEVGDKGSVVFQVFADGVKLFDSGVMTGASATQHIDVGVGNKSDLRFVVTDAGDNNYYDHADWAGAAITCASAPQNTPTVTLNTSTLAIYHLHTGTIKATFNNYPAGPIALRLVPDPFVQPSNGNAQRYPNLALQTTQVALTGAKEETRDLVISAPQQGVTFADALSGFHIITSVNGVDVESIPVTLTEVPLKLRAYFTPNPLSGKPGERVQTTLHMDIDPPLSFTPSMSVGIYVASPSGAYPYTAGTSTGNGGAVDLPISVKFPDTATDYNSAGTLDFFINLGSVGGGTRDPYYGAALRATLNVKLVK